MKKASICIISYNGANRVKYLLESIKVNTRLNREDYEIILLDDGSRTQNRNKMAQLAKDYSVDTFIQNETNLGITKSWNNVVSEASTDVIALLNDDIIVTPGWLRAGVYFVENNDNVGTVGYPTFFMKEEDMPKYFKNNWLNPRHPQTKKLLPPDEFQVQLVSQDKVPGACCVSVGCAFLFKKSVWEKVGKFEEKIKSLYEDYDFCTATMAHGYQNYQLRNPIIYHCLSGTFSTNHELRASQELRKSTQIYVDKWGETVDKVADPMFQANKRAVRTKFLDSKFNEKEELCEV